jgi:small conductance mechanosensitive channel
MTIALDCPTAKDSVWPTKGIRFMQKTSKNLSTKPKRQTRSLAYFSIIGILIWGLSVAPTVKAQINQTPETPPGERGMLESVPDKVEITHLARDEEISTRIQSILTATGWFINPEVRIEEGVVFLSGETATEETKLWARNLARITQDVVAVVNHIKVAEVSVWDLGPAWLGLKELWRDLIGSLPFVFFGLLVLILSFLVAMLTAWSMRTFLQKRIRARLLRNVLARGAAIFVLLSGIYIILRVSGLTQLAMTVVGGTGLIGLALGIAFRNITENFLASIFLSLQRPFENGDLVQVCGETGYIQQLNMRTTVLMTFGGNLVQIPNAAVYQSNLHNFTTNANRCENFAVGIGYDDSIDEAQEIALKVLVDHPAVLKEPEPSVLVENLGQSTVNLRAYFWINGREHSWLKVRSSIIRLVKRAYQEHGISMPDEAREVVFPNGVPVTMVEEKLKKEDTATPSGSNEKKQIRDSCEASSKAEGGLNSEAQVIENQAKQVRIIKDAENLLDASTTPQSKSLEDGL